MSSPRAAPDLHTDWIHRLLAERRRRAAAGPAFDAWLETFRKIHGERFLTPEPKQDSALREIYRESRDATFHELLFCIHTYFAQVIRSTAERGGVQLRWPHELFGWPGRLAAGLPVSGSGNDLFKPLYQRLLPRSVRHGLGEYYTPDWLAELMLSESGYGGDPGQRLLDPSCGTGTFLLLAIGRARRFAGPRRILANIRGLELNPLAALAARANCLLALGETGGELSEAEDPILVVDAILRPDAGERYDFVVGNPPWIRWDDLPAGYRESTLPLWKEYGLFSLKGFAARLGAGKKDLSMLFTYAAADRYLKPGGTLAFLITQEVLKSKGAGEGFRRFRIGAAGSPLRVTRAHDFSAILPFEGVSNKTAGIVMTKGEETTYPLPYLVWKRSGLKRKATRYLAHPLSTPTGPWQTRVAGAPSVFPLNGRGHYKPMLGANANPYGVFWLEIIGTPSGGLVTARNLAEMGKKDVAGITALLETELIHPAVRGRDVARWHTRPGVHVLVVQDPQTRSGYPEETLRLKWPAVWDYVSRFRRELVSRALYRKYHLEAGRPFYSQFNIGSETFLPFKVVWKRMSNDLTAAVISSAGGPLGAKLVLPLETTGIIGCRREDEAHYICAVLNSRPARDFVRSFSAAGRGFGTPSVVRHLDLPRFDDANPCHRRLAGLSAELHRIRKGATEEGMFNLEAEIDGAIPALAG